MTANTSVGTWLKEIRQAHARLQTASVAVRSSLTIEDGAATSLAGLASTKIGRMNEGALLEAVRQIWSDAAKGPVREYLRQLGRVGAELAAAIVVQVLIPAEAAGVLMTRDPLERDRPQIIVEAAWGLGESVVSGLVTPDRYVLEPASGAIVDQQIGFKPTQHTEAGLEMVPEILHRASCLSQADLTALAQSGREAEALFGWPCDIEWARAAGKIWLLQARPITTDNLAEQLQIRREEIERTRSYADPRGTIWLRNAFAQELPEPTPMTWSVLKSLLSAQGGFGQMYRELGFHPDPVLDESGSYDLICGRLYCNWSREPLFYANGLPLAYNFTALRHDSTKLSQARPELDWQRADFRFWLELPRHFLRSIALPRRLNRALQSFPQDFRSRIVPQFRRLLESSQRCDWAQLDDAKLQESLHYWIDTTLIGFARDALKAGVLAGHLETSLTDRLTQLHGADQARATLTVLAGDVQLDPEIDLPGSLRSMLSGAIDPQTFLARFGHRGGREWELAEPRWSEAPNALGDLLRQAEQAQKSPAVRSLPQLPPTLAVRADALRQMLALRELARHYLLRGYQVIRQILLEWDRRLDLDGGIFHLSLEDLEHRTSSSDLAGRSSRIRRCRRLTLGLPVPPTLFSDDLEAIGRPTRVDASTEPILRGIPLSPGEAEGVAFVPKDPRDGSPPAEPFVLVCACTDPAWILLAGQARALVTETGGVLSHGAILARELGLPAVGGVIGACDRLRGGAHVRVDGARGSITISS